MAVPELRPLSVGEILDVAIKIFFRHAWTLIRIILVVAVPVQLLVTLVDASATRGLFSGVETGETAAIAPSDLPTVVGGFALIAVLSVVGYVLAVAACFKAVADAYLGAEPDWIATLRFAGRRLHSILWVLVLSGVLGGLALLALIVPGIWLFVAWTVAIPALLTEDVRGLAALRRSFRLVRGRWWPTFVVVLLGSVLAGIVSAIVGGLAAAAAFFAVSPIAVFAAAAVSNVIGYAIATPFYAAFVTVLYFDFRVRKEAFDLQLVAERLGSERRPGASLGPPPVPAAPEPPEPGDRPPYWPPPPGWKPGGDADT